MIRFMDADNNDTPFDVTVDDDTQAKYNHMTRENVTCNITHLPGGDIELSIRHPSVSGGPVSAAVLSDITQVHKATTQVVEAAYGHWIGDV